MNSVTHYSNHTIQKWHEAATLRNYIICFCSRPTHYHPHFVIMNEFTCENPKINASNNIY